MLPKCGGLVNLAAGMVLVAQKFEILFENVVDTEKKGEEIMSSIKFHKTGTG